MQFFVQFDPLHFQLNLQIRYKFVHMVRSNWFDFNHLYIKIIEIKPICVEFAANWVKNIDALK